MPLRTSRFIRAAAAIAEPGLPKRLVGWRFALRDWLQGPRLSLLLLVIAASIPVLAFAGWTAYRRADEERTAARNTANQAVYLVAERVTAEIDEQLEAAETLARSTALDQPDLAAFYLEAERVRQAHPLWFTVELDDPAGMQILNLLRPLGARLGPTADRDSFDKAVRSQRPVVGGIGPIGPISARQLVSLRVPIIRNGELIYVLTVSFAPDAIGSILRAARAPEGWLGAVVDARGNLIARTVAEQSQPGQPASAAVREAIGRARGGFYRARTLENVEVETVFTTLPESGDWSVHLGVPSELLNRPVRRSFFALGGSMGASLALALGLAMLVSHEFTRQRREQDRLASLALTASEDRAALAIEAAEFGTWHWDPERRRATGSELTRALLNLALTNPAESSWPEVEFLTAVHHEDREAFKMCLSGNDPCEVEFRVQDNSGERWIRARGRAQHVAPTGEQAIFGIIADVTPQKRAEAEHRELLRRLAEVQEEAQRRIARELHDQVGQTVTGLSLGLRGLERSLAAESLAGSEAIRSQVRWLQDLAIEIGRDIHRVAADLRPTALDDFGLTRALSALGADWSSHFGVRIEMQVVGRAEVRLPSEVETVAYRVVQEALTNALKHANATHVSIVVEQRRAQLKIVVEDNGVGFDADANPISGEASAADPGHRGRLGISGMRERLSLLDGDLRIESASGVGTSVFVRIPLDADSSPGAIA